METTLAILKPDALRRNLGARILAEVEAAGFRILAVKTHMLSKREAEQFYSVHASQPFFQGLTDYMSSGPIIVVALQKEQAVKALRTLIGSTDPKNAGPDTIRAKFGLSQRENSIHGSDSPESALKEVSFFFATHELMKVAL